VKLANNLFHRPPYILLKTEPTMKFKNHFPCKAHVQKYPAVKEYSKDRARIYVLAIHEELCFINTISLLKEAKR